MTPERFWLVSTRGRVAVIHDETEALKLASGGVYEASGPYVPETELRIAAGINAQMIDERDTARTDHLHALQAIRDLLHRDKTGAPLPFTRPAREYISDAIDRLLGLRGASDEEDRA